LQASNNIKEKSKIKIKAISNSRLEKKIKNNIQGYTGGGVMKETKTLVGQVRAGGGVKQKVLAILVASVLFAFSFTLNSCKDCGKKKTEPAGRGGNTNNTDTSSDIPKPPEPKRELTPLQKIQALVDKAAGYAYAAWFAENEASGNTENGVAFTEGKLKEVVTAGKEQMNLVQEAEAAEKPEAENKSIKNNLEAIKLLLLKTKREEKFTEYWVAYEVYEAARKAAKKAKRKVTKAAAKAAGATQEEYEAQAATAERAELAAKAKNKVDDESDMIDREWNKAWKENSDAVEIARKAFVKAATTGKGKKKLTAAKAHKAFEE
jgi:hypothetical protein